MSYIGYRDFGLEVSKDNIPNHSEDLKFGRNAAVGTSFVPVCLGGVYQTPQAASATTLRIKAGGNANDTAAGSGAREVTLIGLDASGALVTEALATAGASASAATTNSFMRLFRAYVSESGTYGTATAGSHSGDIVIENSAGGTDWATIDSTGFPKGQSEIGVLSIASGVCGYLFNFLVTADSSKTTDFILFKRDSILDSAAPYEAMRAQFVGQTTGENTRMLFNPPIRFDGPCDVGFMAKVGAGTASVSVDFNLILVSI